VPFCESKCRYCGFYSVAADPRLMALYPDLLIGEWSQVRRFFPDDARPVFETVYIGGGTPAMLGAEGLANVVSRLETVVDLSAVEEWTVELNPASVSETLLERLRSLGVNRVSVGVQSLDDDTLARMGRRHTSAEAVRAVRMIQEQGFGNVGIDLIAGFPQVTGAMWHTTLEKALALDLVHVSVYALSVEEQTPLASHVARGECVLPGDEAQMDALAQAEELLTAAGFHRYEISNYAMPGFACRHNLGIWRGNDFLGLGPSAASRVGRRRWTQPARLSDYLEAILQGMPLQVDREVLTDVEDALERVMFCLRLEEGIDPFAVAACHPVLDEYVDRWEEQLEALARKGVVERGGRRWRLTGRGREVCDAVIRDLF